MLSVTTNSSSETMEATDHGMISLKCGKNKTVYLEFNSQWKYLSKVKAK